MKKTILIGLLCLIKLTSNLCAEEVVHASAAPLPNVIVPSMEEQLEMYQGIFIPYKGRESEIATLHIEGWQPMLDIAFSFTRKWVSADDEKMQLLEKFWNEALSVMEQKKMTLFAYEMHMLRLAGLIQWKDEYCDVNDSAYNYPDAFKSDYAIENPHYIQCVSSASPDFQTFEAILCEDEGIFSYDLFVDAIAGEMPLVLAGLSNHTHTPEFNACSINFMHHDFAHNQSIWIDADIKRIRNLIHAIREAKGHALSARDKAIIYHMGHEKLLSKHYDDNPNAEKALHLWGASVAENQPPHFLSAIYSALIEKLQPLGDIARYQYTYTAKLISQNTIQLFFQYNKNSFNKRFIDDIQAYLTIGNVILEYAPSESDPKIGTFKVIESNIPPTDSESILKQLPPISDEDPEEEFLHIISSQYAKQMASISQMLANNFSAESIIEAESIHSVLSSGPTNEEIEFLLYIYGTEAINNIKEKSDLSTIFELSKLWNDAFDGFVEEYAPLLKAYEERNGLAPASGA